MKYSQALHCRIRTIQYPSFPEIRAHTHEKKCSELTPAGHAVTSLRVGDQRGPTYQYWVPRDNDVQVQWATAMKWYVETYTMSNFSGDILWSRWRNCKQAIYWTWKRGLQMNLAQRIYYEIVGLTEPPVCLYDTSNNTYMKMRGGGLFPWWYIKLIDRGQIQLNKSWGKFFYKNEEK
jgi:hypothetical protein